MSTGSFAYNAQAGTDAENLLSERLSSMAHERFSTQMPDVYARVEAFQVLHVDISTGTASGAFALRVGDTEVHVPVVLSGSGLEPLDLMYLPAEDRFLPLSLDWIETLESHDPTSMGDSIAAPKGLQTDVDIRNVVVPPMTGRYTYASAAPRQRGFMGYLSKVGDAERRHIIARMRSNKRAAKLAFEFCGVDALKARLTVAPMHKTAMAYDVEPDVEVFLPGDDFAKMASAVGPRSSLAMMQLGRKGYAVADRRPLAKTAVTVEHMARLESPNAAGIYRMYLNDGTDRLALVVPQPQSLRENLPGGRRAPNGRVDAGSTWARCHDTDSPGADTQYLVFTDRNEAAMFNGPLMAVRVYDYDDRAARWLLSLLGQASPPARGRGFFARMHHGKLQASEPARVTSVSRLPDGSVVAEAMFGYGQRTADDWMADAPATLPPVAVLRVAPNYRYSEIQVTNTVERGTSTSDVHIPLNYSWVPVTRVLDPSKFVRSLDELMARAQRDAKVAAISRVRVDRPLGGAYKIAGEVYYARGEAARALIVGHGLREPSAEFLLRLSEKTGAAEAMAPTEEELMAMEQAGMLGADPATAGMDPAMAGMDPAMAGMDPAMMGPDPAQMAMMQAQAVEQATSEIMDLFQMQHDEIMRRIEDAQRTLSARQMAIEMMLTRTSDLMSGAPPMAGAEMLQVARGLADQDLMTAAQAQAGQPPPQAAQPPAVPAPAPEPVDPSMVEEAAELPPEAAAPAMDAALLGSMASSEGLGSLGGDHLREFQDALNALGRVLLDLRLKGPQLRGEIGDRAYETQVERTRRVLSNLSPLVLDLSRNALLYAGAAPSLKMEEEGAS